MVIGIHHVTCLICGNDHVYGDAIDLICPECRKEREKMKKKKTEVTEPRQRQIELEDEN